MEFESLNAVLINDGLEQSQRLEKLNRIAISQMKILIGDGNEVSRVKEPKPQYIVEELSIVKFVM